MKYLLYKYPPLDLTEIGPQKSSQPSHFISKLHCRSKPRPPGRRHTPGSLLPDPCYGPDHPSALQFQHPEASNTLKRRSPHSVVASTLDSFPLPRKSSLTQVALFVVTKDGPSAWLYLDLLSSAPAPPSNDRTAWRHAGIPPQEVRSGTVIKCHSDKRREGEPGQGLLTAPMVSSFWISSFSSFLLRVCLSPSLPEYLWKMATRRPMA